MNSWIVQRESVDLVGRIHSQGVEFGIEVCGVPRSAA